MFVVRQIAQEKHCANNDNCAITWSCSLRGTIIQNACFCCLATDETEIDRNESKYLWREDELTPHGNDLFVVSYDSINGLFCQTESRLWHRPAYGWRSVCYKFVWRRMRSSNNCQMVHARGGINKHRPGIIEAWCFCARISSPNCPSPEAVFQLDDGNQPIINDSAFDWNNAWPKRRPLCSPHRWKQSHCQYLAETMNAHDSIWIQFFRSYFFCLPCSTVEMLTQTTRKSIANRSIAILFF